MKKVILSMFVMGAFCLSTTVVAQDTKKETKAKTECTKSEKKSCCAADKKADTKSCCSEKKSADTKDTKSCCSAKKTTADNKSAGKK